MFEKSFNFIKNEEITKFKRDVNCAKGEAVQNGTLSSSVYIDKLRNLAKNSYKTTYNNFINKLKEDELQSYIKKDSEIFTNLITVLLDELITVITEAHVPSSNSQYNDESITRLDGMFRPPLVKLKDELIDNWNMQAEIERTKNKKKKKDHFKNFGWQILVGVVSGILVLIAWASFSQKPSVQNMSSEPQQKAIIQKIK